MDKDTRPYLVSSDFGFSAQKGGFFGEAAAQGIAILFPDTSPRGAGIDGEDADWDFGTGKFMTSFATWLI